MTSARVTNEMNETPCIAVVTGTARGIGQAITERLAQDGRTVWAIDTTEQDPASASISGIRNARVDVADPAAVRRFFAKRAEEGAAVDVLVNNAAIMGGAAIREQSLDQWQCFLDVNVTGAWLMIKHALPLFRKGGSIVNIGSVASVAGFAERAAYCAAKHALAGMTKALAAELARENIRVNLLCLGGFDTPGLRELAQRSGEDMAKRQLMQRLGTVEEAADACAFLASEQSAFMTGSIMSVDGGLLTKAGQ